MSFLYRRLLFAIHRHSPQLVWAVCTAVAVAGLLFAWRLLEPPCPTTIEIATGSAEGQYYALAQRYREILARHGIELKVRSTAGSVENARLLRDEHSGVSLAILQGGAVPAEPHEVIHSLASLYLEPLWIFYREDVGPWEDLEQLAGRRVAIGPRGSGTQTLALTLLGENGLLDGASGKGVTTLELDNRAALDALVKQEVDAVFMVTSPRTALVQTMIGSEREQLLNLRRATAYCRKYPYLTQVTLHEGVVDLQQNMPPRDINLLAPTASLVARSDLHPALVPLLLEAATEVHEGGGYLEEPGDFPSPSRVDFPLSPEAKSYFQRGPNMLYRLLPFRWAASVDRMKMMIFPLVTLLFPMLRVAPPVYRWSIRSKIYRWYRVLRAIDQRMKDAEPNADFASDIRRLENLEVELAEVSVPLSYMAEFYSLRLHVEFVLARLKERQPAEQRLRPAA